MAVLAMAACSSGGSPPSTSGSPLCPNNGSLLQQTQQCVSTGRCPEGLLQQLLTVERTYAKGRPVFDLSSAGIDPQSTQSSQFQAKEAECRSLTGGSVPNLSVT